MNGQCYPNSFKQLERLHKAGEAETDPDEKSIYQDLRLIHGYSTPDCGPEIGKEIDHAWVEMSGYAFESSDSVENPGCDLIEIYKEKYDAKERASYSYEQALKLRETEQTYGPWDDEGKVLRNLAK
jgi:hypothetical protein